MGKKEDEIILTRLFIAVPELTMNLDALDEMYKIGLISKQDLDKYKTFRSNFRRADRLAGQMEGKSLQQRLLLVAPQLFSASTIDLLRTMGVISVAQGHEMRIMLKYGNIFGKWDSLTTKKKLSALYDTTVGFEMIDYMMSSGLLVNEIQAEFMRGVLSAGRGANLTRKEMLEAKKPIDVALALVHGLLDNGVIRGLVKMGVLDAKTAMVYRRAIPAIDRTWRVFRGVKAGQGYQQRLLLGMTGSFHSDFLDILFDSGVIDRRYRTFFRAGEVVATRVNDRILEDLTKRRYRVVSGEAPIKSFARQSRRSQQEILTLLAEAAKEAEDLAKKLDTSKPAGAIRAAQLRATRGQLYDAMQKYWEGVGHLTVFGQKEAAMLAAESVDDLSRALLGPQIGQQARNSILFQSKAGVDAYISRQENIVPLSRKVYGNIAIHSGQIDKRINIALLQGKSASEFAKDISQYINPNVSGGVKYASMRLARTEINNAFHLSQQRFTREQPWVRGYQWHRSRSSGGSLDKCHEYANQDNYNLGVGGFPKSSVPDKPHPNCMCYITTIVMDQATFAFSMSQGRFDRYFSRVAKGTVNEDVGGDGILATTSFAILEYGVKKQFAG